MQKPTGTAGSTKLRYQFIREAIRGEIESRKFGPGDRLPSDGSLAKHFDVSRLTVIRALRELEVAGLLQRKAGSGTFVKNAADPTNHVFGLLMPDLGDGEVFEPICQGIVRAGEALHHRLLWEARTRPARTKKNKPKNCAGI